jgi:molybdenum-dependent DNA-binding transcriptional regulator ModE
MQLRRGIKIAHLRLMAALAATGQVGAAAEAVGITQPAASRLLAEVERMTGTPLYARTGRGIALTAEGVALAARCCWSWNWPSASWPRWRAAPAGKSASAR